MQLTVSELIDKFASGLMIVLFLTQVFKFDISRANSSFPHMVIISNFRNIDSAHASYDFEETQ